jgi:hypothetical protein
MPEDRVAEYLSALNRSHQAKKAAQEVVDEVLRCAAALHHFRRLGVEDESGTVEYDGDVTPASPRLDLKNWPTAERIRTAVRQYHTAVQVARNAWQLVPPERRQGLQPPP